MDNVLDLKGYKTLKGDYNETKYGNFVREVKNKYGNRNPPLMVSTIDNFNNEGIVVQAGGPSESDVWFIYFVKEHKLMVNDGFLSFLRGDDEVGNVSKDQEDIDV